MLKIKNNIDLEELEKFGFYKSKEISLIGTDIYGYKYKLGDAIIFISKNTKEIDLLYADTDDYEEFMDKIFDLMQNNLIEKMSNYKDDELKAIQDAISRQVTNNYPQIFIQDLQSGRMFEYGKNCHDRLVISEDGRSLHYVNLQNGDGSKCGDYRFYYKKTDDYISEHYDRFINNIPKKIGD